MRLLPFLVLLPLIAGCDQLGIETPAQQMARQEAEGKAIGGSCRQAGRALEDCYQLNPKAPKASIFEGWRDMDAYMRENKIEEVQPRFPMSPPKPKRKPFEAAEDEDAVPAPTAPARPTQDSQAPKADEKPAEAPAAGKQT